MPADDYVIRDAMDADLDAIVAVGQAALGWRPDEPNRGLFEWKHLDNAFGRSPIWVAERDGVIGGYRCFMRWELVGPDGRTLRAVRAVDTATHPDHQRQGIFSALARHGIAAMTGEGVDLVFNTPNTQSRPGYLKLGWTDVGRLPLRVKPTGVGSIRRIAGARTSADKWSQEVSVGVPATEAMAAPEFAALVEGQPDPAGIRTAWTARALRWRYGLGLLHYRAWAPDGVADGAVIFRVRGRGAARECAVGAVLSPYGDDGRARRLLRSLAAAVDADYLAILGAAPRGAGFVPVPRQGPRLTVRDLASVAPAKLDGWALTLGDIELF